MFVGVLELDLRLAGCRSLKEKRQRLRSFIDRLRHGFNLSVAEIDHQDNWQLAAVGVAAVSSDRKVVQRLLEEVIDVAESTVDGELIGVSSEIL